ncbi:MAG: nucleotidyltransferase domain-containing protein [Firmicutes bacterium]|nr:nucleotidyltransferase domain-containing protein [Bacillota bacterium]
MSIITAQKRKRLNDLFKNYHPDILLVILFGSYQTKYQRPDSDIDFAILFQEKIGLQEEMKLLAQLSDILEYENVDLVNLNTAPVTLQFNALGGTIIYEKDHVLTSNFIEKVLKIYGDYAPVLAKFDREMLEQEISYHE